MTPSSFAILLLPGQTEPLLTRGNQAEAFAAQHNGTALAHLDGACCLKLFERSPYHLTLAACQRRHLLLCQVIDMLILLGRCLLIEQDLCHTGSDMTQREVFHQSHEMT